MAPSPTFSAGVQPPAKMTSPGFAFSHLPVSKKLVIAFGSILALTLLVMFTGLRSTDRMVDNADDSYRLSHLEMLLLDAQAQLERFIASGAPDQAKSLEAQIDQMQAQLDDNLHFLQDARQQQGLTQIQQALQSYRAAFSQLTQAQARRDSARGQLVSAGNATVAAFDALQKAAFTKLVGTSQDPTLVQRVQLASQLNQKLLNIRYLVRGYIFQQTDEADKAASGALKDLADGLAVLVDQAPADEQATLRTAGDSLSQYQAGYGLFRQGMRDSKVAAQSLAEQGQVMRSASGDLYRHQLEARADAVSRARLSLLGISAFAVLLGVLAAWLISRQIVRPLRKLLATSTRIAAGDLRTVKVEHRQDELGQLERSIDGMAQNLRQLIGFIAQGVVQISDAAEQLSVATHAASAGVDRQRIETDQVATAMNQMTATVHDVARNAEDASMAATETDREAQSGDQKVGQAVRALEHLNGEVSRSADAVLDLEGECRQISGVLEVIKSVAEQTNLLALNAAIEAARAGEAGRGFAVVADEVRALASRTQGSATQIDGLLERLLKGAGTAAQFMQASRSLTASTLDLGREAGDSLGKITQAVSTIQAMNLQIAAAAEQQTAVAEQINRSIVQVRTAAEQTASSSANTAQSSAVLVELGVHLQAKVRHFQL
jgi:methyl-accepting chemotaxis protein